MNPKHKSLGDLTLAEVQAEGFKALGAFVDAWIKAFGYWDPTEALGSIEMKVIA